MIFSILLYSGAGVAALAALGVLPLTLGFGGALVALIALALPTDHPASCGEETLLDRFLVEWHFSERHVVTINASEESVCRAIREVTAGEIRFFLLLAWLRSPRLSGRGPESILHPDPARPILDTALRTGFVELGEDEGREIVFGALLENGGFRACPDPGMFRGLAEPGLAKAAMNFRMTTLQPGRVRLSTETRVGATDARTRRRFGVYWRLILPGSALIRHHWLAAIRRRSERPA